MLAGHYAPALALRRVAPTLPLWCLFVAVEVADILWSLLVLVGIEDVEIVPGFNESNALDLRFVPYSHSLAASLGWSLVAGLLWFAFRGGDRQARVREAVVIGVAVGSHFALDLLVHVPDLPVAGGHGLKLGLGLWHHPVVAMSLEAALVGAAAWWARRGAARPKRWRVVVVVLLVVAALAYVVPAPPSAAGMALTGLALYAALTRLASWAEAADPT